MSSVTLKRQPGVSGAAAAERRTRSRFSVRFRGVRGSYAVPGKGTIGVGGNTPCVEVRAGEHVVIFDAGTGIIELGREMVADYYRTPEERREPITVSIFYSHLHHDHTQGFPFFSPAYIPGTTIFIMGPRLARRDLEETLTNALLAPFFPVDLDEMNAELVIRNFGEDEVALLSPGSREPQIVNVVRSRPALTPEHVVVRNFHGYSHPGGIRYYRLEYQGKSVVYASDTEGYVGGDVKLAKFAAGADVLIHDAQYREREYVGGPVPKQGYGHSTPAMAAAVAAAAGVDRLLLFHHDPNHDDETVAEMEHEARRLFAPSTAAHEGMTIDLL